MNDPNKPPTKKPLCKTCNKANSSMNSAYCPPCRIKAIRLINAIMNTKEDYD